MLEHDDPRHPRFDPKYGQVDACLLPAGESLEDTRGRVVHYWREELLPRVRAGARIVVASHGNTLRALMMELQDLSEAEVERLEIPTGTPLVCEFDESMQLVKTTMLKAGAKIAA